MVDDIRLPQILGSKPKAPTPLHSVRLRHKSPSLKVPAKCHPSLNHGNRNHLKYLHMWWGVYRINPLSQTLAF